jgi:DNA-directed RNA polymerase subunit RPC12/RpoP
MLIWAEGKCEACGKKFRPPDVLQSVRVECADCGREQSLCPACKSEGCPSCGGRLLDAWERVDRDFPGQGVMF